MGESLGIVIPLMVQVLLQLRDMMNPEKQEIITIKVLH